MYLLDTNICSYFMKNQYPLLTERILSISPSELAISSVTVFELEYGAVKKGWGQKTRKKVAMFLAPFRIIPFDTDDAIESGKVRAELERLGTPIGSYDILIASQARARDGIVITHNFGEFIRVPGLKVEDWTI